MTWQMMDDLGWGTAVPSIGFFLYLCAVSCMPMLYMAGKYEVFRLFHLSTRSLPSHYVVLRLMPKVSAQC